MKITENIVQTIVSTLEVQNAKNLNEKHEQGHIEDVFV